MIGIGLREPCRHRIGPSVGPEGLAHRRDVDAREARPAAGRGVDDDIGLGRRLERRFSGPFRSLERQQENDRGQDHS